VLSLADAHALERIVRMHATDPARDATTTGDAPAPPLLALDARELVRLGLISNRGMLVVAAAVGFVAQTDSKLFAEFARVVGGTLMGWGERLHLETAGFVVAALALMLAAVAVLRVFSIVIAFLQFHGFTLRRDGERLNVQRGLLTRLRGSLPRDRIQAFDLHEGLLHRWFGRRSLQVDTMSADSAMEGTSLRHLAPIATPDAMDALVATLLPRASWPPAAWRPLHPAAWVRQWLPGAALWLLATGVLSWRFGAWGALALLGVPWAAYAARQWARRAGYAEAGGLVAVREGWLDVHWRFAETRKVQALRLSRSPLDKRFGMASVLLDTAGGSPGMNALRVRYLAEADARALYAALSQAMAATALAAPRRVRVTRARSVATAAPAP
jgi:putative membrane protein